LPLFTNGQFAVIRGTITSEKYGTSLENVNILEKLSEIGTISNTRGEFSLMLHPGNTELIVTLDGYESVARKFKLHADTTVNIALEPKLNFKNRQKSSTQADLAQKTDKK
jgi:hypothetical protein